MSFPVQCFGFFSPQNEASFIIENRLSSGVSYGFRVIDGCDFYRTWAVLNKTRTGAVRRDWLLKAVLCFPFIFTFATKFLCTAGEVAQTMTLSDGQYLYFPIFRP